MRPGLFLQQRGRSQRVAFTLTELLVSITIVALLISILAPSLSRARAQSRSAKCLAHLHELQAAALVYASQNHGYLPASSEPGAPSWAAQLARQVGLRFPGNTPGSLNDFSAFRCPDRSSGQSSRFIDYVANAMNPEGPSADGTWLPLPVLRADAYRQSSLTIYLADAEREDQVVHIAGHPGGDTVKDAHDNYSAGRFDLPTLGDMTVWTGSHLPEGKDCVNVTEDPGVRRAARKLHLSRFSNSSFLDGHALSVAPAGWPLDEANYGVWLARYGVKDFETVKTLPIQ